MKSGNPSEWETGPPRRILGMKIWQVALLGGMAMLDCLVLVVGAVLLLGAVPSTPGGGLMADAPATSTPVVPPLGATVAPSPSITPMSLAFQLPTYTPYGTPAETFTPTPSETFTPTPSVTGMMEGWVKFSVPTIEIWMPGSFVAGNPKTDTDAIIASLKEKGANYNWDLLKKQLGSLRENYVMWAIDSYQINPNVVTNIAFAYGVPHPGEPLGDYATRLVRSLSDGFRLVEQSKARHPEYEAVLIILEPIESAETPTQMAFYFLRHQNLIWGVMCFTAADEMTVRLPDFNRMVETFRVLQPL